MPKRSAGLLMYRYREGKVEVLLVHPGGPYWIKKDVGAWSIPKGEYSPEEDPLEAAKREFKEETGFTPVARPSWPCYHGLEARATGDFRPLKPVVQPSGKEVTAWAFEGDCDPAKCKSNTFSMEWPPGSGRQQEFPEIDRAGWFTIEEAKKKILKGQIPILEQFEQVIKGDL
jgi:predicted NUDIX family NTP pyrophosphohydrolase